jgi:excisionase family DNA binding protein
MPAPRSEYEPLLTPAEVSAIFRCDVKTVVRWDNQGKLTSIRTPGGHRRFLEREVRALFEGKPDPLAAPAATIWPPAVTGPAATAKRKITTAKITTVGQLVACDVVGLAKIGIKGEALDAVRLALYKKGLALKGEVVDKVA